MESQPKTNAFLIEFILTASSTCSFAIAFSFNLWQQTTAGTQSNLQDVRTRRRSGSRSCCWSCTILISYAPLKARTIKIPKWPPRQRTTWRLTFMSSPLPTTCNGNLRTSQLMEQSKVLDTNYGRSLTPCWVFSKDINSWHLLQHHARSSSTCKAFLELSILCDPLTTIEHISSTTDTNFHPSLSYGFPVGKDSKLRIWTWQYP